MEDHGVDWTIVDYSEAFFEDRGETVPGQREGKFVVIEHDGQRYAVFSPRGLSEYHAQIAERFLTLRGVGGRYGSRRDVYRPVSPAWKIAGGGHWQLDQAAGWLRVYGESRAYGPAPLDAVAGALRQSREFGRLQDIAVG